MLYTVYTGLVGRRASDGHQRRGALSFAARTCHLTTVLLTAQEPPGMRVERFRRSVSSEQRSSADIYHLFATMFDNFYTYFIIRFHIGNRILNILNCTVIDIGFRLGLRID